MFERFVIDLRTSGAKLLEIPLVPAITAGLALTSAIVTGSFLSFFFLPVSLFETGWAGTQQLLFIRHVKGSGAMSKSIWSVTWGYVGRFFVLGLFFIPFVAVLLFFVFASGDIANFRPPLAARLAVSIPLIGIEALLTFVFPALALSTQSVMEAWRIGLRLLRENWPRDLWYALAPAVTLQSAYAFISPARDSNIAVNAAVGVALALVALWFRATIVTEYVRLYEAKGPQGEMLA